MQIEWLGAVCDRRTVAARPGLIFFVSPSITPNTNDMQLANKLGHRDWWPAGKSSHARDGRLVVALRGEQTTTTLLIAVALRKGGTERLEGTG